MTTVPGHPEHLDPTAPALPGWPDHNAQHSDPGIHDFLILGDGAVRYLLDVLLRLDEAGLVLDDAHATRAELHAVHGDVRTMVASLEQHLRRTNVAMLGITSDWPMITSGRGAPALRTASTTG